MANPFTQGASGPADSWDPRNPNSSRMSVSERWKRATRRWNNNWRMNGPNITQVLVGINVVVFLALRILALFPEAYTSTIIHLEMIPRQSFTNPWMLITAGFMHEGIFHLVMNMLALYVVGREMEKLLGHWAFLGLYLVSLLGGNVAFALWPGNLMTPVIGASGAIYGLFGALMTVYRRVGMQTRGTAIFLFVLLFLPMFWGNIAWQAHVGGFIVGALLSLLMMRGLRGLRSTSINKRMAVYGGLFTAILLILWLASLWAMSALV